METPKNAPTLGGWYKFQIWFALFFSAALDVFAGFEILTGKVYELAEVEAAEAHLIHGVWLRGLDLGIGVLDLVLGVLSLVTRFLLARKRRAGIELLHIEHWVDLAGIVLYRGVLSALLGVPCIDALCVFEILFTLAMILINKPYFDKREELFH